MMNFDAQLTLSETGKMYANPRRIALLKAIAETGSISQAAKLAGISYKAAHDAIKDMNNRASQPVTNSEKGGKGGGGAQLTLAGQRLVQMYDLLDQIQDMGLKALNDEQAPLHSLLGVMAKFSLQTSARNQLFGTIRQINNQELHDIVEIQLNSGATVTATITHGSTVRLNLEVGKDVVALIKGPAVSLAREPQPTLFDNAIRGNINTIEHHVHSAEYLLQISEHDCLCASLLTDQQPTSDKFEEGDQVYALFHSSQVIIATLN
ncbi:molybdenum-dependent transcriptional regulator [Photobacterium jeanii]|uniref:Molybdenum-dependent transcriptional regulator n=1 Tax=Photobacterium jeanii TaxID=858640 RepID=A0A178K372_9GAMM|nr:TOBE domain-containing protein [Photobacterium jeanii]OAN11173.1 molybdenum-dependent transcriptional regulator [Photobacterium jeanii]PST90692.1 molybdenum-dependent transcriptional regulator [Photobacterium jeanii]